MKLGAFSMNSDEGLDPLELAREAEGLGIDSIFVQDHSHVPVTRSIPFGAGNEKTADIANRKDLSKGFEQAGGDMPRDFFRNREQFVTLAGMAAVTSTLQIGTGICLVVQRDPLWLAKQIATLDQLSRGRLMLGVGIGSPWNHEEIRNHGTDPSTRIKLMAERMEAMQEIWSNEQAEYHGKFVDFDPIYAWPKPYQSPRPPVFVGGDGPTVLDRVLAIGDGWMPGHHDDMGFFKARVSELQERSAAAGKGHMEITVFLARLDRLDDYVAAGADRAVVMLPTGAERKFLEDIADAKYRF